MSHRPLFAYGTLLIDEILFALLGKVPEKEDAVLEGYLRSAVDRGPGGAKGPVIFPDPNSMVRGVVLLSLCPEEARIIDLYEDAAIGYLRSEVAVRIPNGSSITAHTYVGTEGVRHLASGVWSEQAFREEHLDYYVSEKIPALKRKWS
ncbi:MAG: gamma-glutamylcyclotransferase [Candidatus Eisenbacteria bacterium]|uniref:Putative gamma-glutamylcyclotransferase n=1 Tax=Eiseniibacteriota bacterium TaxID=2212470 RepID=A0A7Y2E8E3_UNCEI|nr:gamma-glutamylcyclotransferase [Candidatus Eisenbacteria bacterium]